MNVADNIFNRMIEQYSSSSFTKPDHYINSLLARINLEMFNSGKHPFCNSGYIPRHKPILYPQGLIFTSSNGMLLELNAINNKHPTSLYMPLYMAAHITKQKNNLSDRLIPCLINKENGKKELLDLVSIHSLDETTFKKYFSINPIKMPWLNFLSDKFPVGITIPDNVFIPSLPKYSKELMNYENCRLNSVSYKPQFDHDELAGEIVGLFQKNPLALSKAFAQSAHLSSSIINPEFKQIVIQAIDTSRSLSTNSNSLPLQTL